ncbi:thermonuclease family protein [Ornithobacterium rhinotracheale]|uniref:thermonuclease family protein n=1 Tax=Ornithobacterium rhinotracheale TaxID=28251 RepID=UPI00129D1872|nr:thermonuclease family protein [Ornithobacterium rhinotracheale]MRJ09960.1 thermonuclease family protein [Ornithobacterium rhinotracheale]
MWCKILFLSFFLVFGACKEYSSHIPSKPVGIKQSIPQGDAFKVIGITDGDTVKLLIDGQEQKIRLAHIDCPEKKQAFGNVAKKAISDLIFGKNVYLVWGGEKDKYGRLIAEIIMEDGTNVNKLLVKKGLAWHFKKYSNNQDYAQLEIEARQNKVGLWVDPNPIPPWIFRQMQREAAKKKKLMLSR